MAGAVNTVPTTVISYSIYLDEYPTLPAPESSFVGECIRVKPPFETGQKTNIYACVVNSQGEYQWVKLAEST